MEIKKYHRHRCIHRFLVVMNFQDLIKNVQIRTKITKQSLGSSLRPF